jgi:hypothetical protein
LLAVYCWVLTAGRWDFFDRRALDDFYDVQARGFLAGRLDVPREAAGIEGFVNHGRTYLYWGPFPAVLRLPVLAVTDRFDGRLTTVSMVAAMVVLAAGTFRLACGLRGIVRGEEAVGRRELWATAALSFVLLAGPPLCLASAAMVYQEAIIWGLALSVVAFDAVVRWQRDPSGGRLVVASGLVLLALMGRQSVALGPAVALAATGGVQLWDRWRAGVGWHRLGLMAASLAVAVLVPVGASSGLHYAKIGVLFGLPFENQIRWESGSDIREELVAARQPSVEHVTRAAGVYLRPVAVEPRRDFPWLDFRRSDPAKLNRQLAFAAVDWSSSLPTGAPALSLLAIGGALWTYRTRRARGPSAALWPLWCGVLAGSVVTLTYCLVADRYLNDLYPVAVIGGLIGFYALAHAQTNGRRALRRGGVVGLGSLAVAGVLVNVALTLELQRERWFLAPEAERAEMVAWRAGLPGAAPPFHVPDETLLPPVVDGALLVVGDCDALYQGVGAPRDYWLPVERGPRAGVFEAMVDVERIAVDDRVPLWTVDAGGAQTVVALERLDARHLRVDVLAPDTGAWTIGRPVIELHGVVRLRASMDPRENHPHVMYRQVVLNPYRLPLDPDRVRLGVANGRQDVQTTFAGIQAVTYNPETCHRATRMNR